MFPFGTGSPLTPLGRAGCGALAALFASVLAVAALVEPDPRGFGTHQRLGLPPCGFHLMFSVPCPSCGSTTSFALFVRGRVGEAFRANPAALFLAAAVTLAWPWLVVSAAIGRLWGVNDPLKGVAILAVVVVLVATVHWLSRVALSAGPWLTALSGSR